MKYQYVPVAAMLGGCSFNLNFDQALDIYEENIHEGSAWLTRGFDQPLRLEDPRSRTDSL